VEQRYEAKCEEENAKSRDDAEWSEEYEEADELIKKYGDGRAVGTRKGLKFIVCDVAEVELVLKLFGLTRQSGRERRHGAY
jgi:hypothetical protein